MRTSQEPTQPPPDVQLASTRPPAAPTANGPLPLAGIAARMPFVKLDLGPLELAIARFEASVAHCKSEAALSDSSLARTIEAGTIQAFEFTYELTWKMLRRHLADTEPDAAAIDELSFPDLIRLGSRRGLLLSDWRSWKRFRQQRGITSHTYDSRKAAEVLQGAPALLDEARFLLARLRERAASA